MLVLVLVMMIMVMVIMVKVMMVMTMMVMAMMMQRRTQALFCTPSCLLGKANRIDDDRLCL